MIYLTLILLVLVLTAAFSARVRQEVFLFLSACKNALRGLRVASSEKNLRIELLCACLAVFLGVICRITVTEWMALTLVIALVIGLEIMNSAIEKLVNKITREEDEDIKAVKDIAAAAVLVTSLCALIIGILIFVPYIKNVLF